MALNVTGAYQTPAGYTVTSVYWRWVGLGIDVGNAQCTVTIHGYLNEAAYTAKYHPIATRQITLTGDEFGALAVAIESPNNPGLSAVIYEKVKLMPEYQGAVDA